MVISEENTDQERVTDVMIRVNLSFHLLPAHSKKSNPGVRFLRRHHVIELAPIPTYPQTAELSRGCL